MRNEVTYFLRRSIQPKTNERGNVTQRNCQSTVSAEQRQSRGTAAALLRSRRASSKLTHTHMHRHAYVLRWRLFKFKWVPWVPSLRSVTVAAAAAVAAAQQSSVTMCTASRADADVSIPQKNITTNVFNENKSSTRCLRRRRRLCRCCKSPPGDEFAVKILVAAVPAWRATELLLRCSRCCCR